MEEKVTMELMEEICREAFPIIDDAVKALHKPGIREQIAIYVGDNGYISVNMNAGDWEATRMSAKDDISVRHSRTFRIGKGDK